MGFVELRHGRAVRDGGKNEDEITGNIIAMRVTHRTTRPNEDDYTPDMSLHDHVFVFNASFDKDGQAKAAEIRRIKHDAPYYAEPFYHNRLAANLQKLGYGIRRTKSNFEIAGIGDELIERFSRRKATIEKVAKELGITDADAKGRLGASTRLRKEDSRLGRGSLPTGWASCRTMRRKQVRDLRGHNSYRGDAEEADAAMPSPTSSTGTPSSRPASSTKPPSATPSAG